MERKINLAIAALFLLLYSITLGCAKPRPQPPPAPPTIEMPAPSPSPPVTVAPSYPRQQPARPGDILVKGCTVKSVKGNRAECICRRANTQLDATDPQKPMVMVCR
jgi:hypothetical protein